MQLKHIISVLVRSLSPFKPFLVIVLFSPWLIIVYLIVSGATAQLSVNDQTVIHDFIEWFGTAYSLFLALVLVNVWAQFDNVEREFDRELDAVSLIYQTAGYVQALKEENEPRIVEFKKKIKDDVFGYLHHVVHKYSIEHLVAQQRINGEKFLERIGSNIGSLAHEQMASETLISELFRSLNDARDIRGDRISHAGQQMPDAVWFVSVVASIVWLLPFFALKIINLWVSSILIGGVTFVVVVVLVIIRDLNNPFEGTWKVNLEDWISVLDTIEPKYHVIFIYNNKNKFIDQVSTTSIGKLLSLNICKLSSLEREGFFRYKWSKFIKEIKRARTEDKAVKCDLLFKDDIVYGGYDELFKGLNAPCVVLKHGEQIECLLSDQEIDSCPNLTELINLFNRKIKIQISWY